MTMPMCLSVRVLSGSYPLNSCSSKMRPNLVCHVVVHDTKSWSVSQKVYVAIFKVGITVGVEILKLGVCVCGGGGVSSTS